MLEPKIRLQDTISTKPAQRVASKVFIQSYGDSDAFAHLLQSLQSHSLFLPLLQAGILRELRFRGVIPRAQQAEYNLEEAVRLVQTYHLDQQPDWQTALNGAYSQERLETWALRWNVPKEILLPIFRALKSDPFSDKSRLADPIASSSSSSSLSEASDVFETTLQFVRQYNLSQQQFISYILQGDYSPNEIAAQFGCSILEAQQLTAAMARLDILDTFVAASTTPLLSQEEVIAQAEQDIHGHLKLQFVSARLSGLYSIDTERIEELRRSIADPGSVRTIMELVQAVNERSTTLANLVYLLCKIQSVYLQTGEKDQLRPLQAAEVARQLPCHRSIVGRLVKGLYLQTSRGRVRLSDLMPRRQTIIANLLKQHPTWSDQQVADYFESQFDISLCRRDINYHRHQIAQKTS